MDENLCPRRWSQATHAVPNCWVGRRAGLKNRWEDLQIGLQGSLQTGISFGMGTGLSPQAGEAW